MNSQHTICLLVAKDLHQSICVNYSVCVCVWSCAGHMTSPIKPCDPVWVWLTVSLGSAVGGKRELAYTVFHTLLLQLLLVLTNPSYLLVDNNNITIDRFS